MIYAVFFQMRWLIWISCARVLALKTWSFCYKLRILFPHTSGFSRLKVLPVSPLLSPSGLNSCVWMKRLACIRSGQSIRKKAHRTTYSWATCSASFENSALTTDKRKCWTIMSGRLESLPSFLQRMAVCAEKLAIVFLKQLKTLWTVLFWQGPTFKVGRLPGPTTLLSKLLQATSLRVQWWGLCLCIKMIFLVWVMRCVLEKSLKLKACSQQWPRCIIVCINAVQSLDKGVSKPIIDVPVWNRLTLLFAKLFC